DTVRGTCMSVFQQKPRIGMRSEESFDFLDSTIRRFHGKDGRVYIGTGTSKKLVGKVRARLREEASGY
ncbi:MAG TPA: hypothetical protein VGE74_06125, partial [Gemmata sp.]